MAKIKIASDQFTTVIKHLDNHPLKAYVSKQLQDLHKQIADLETDGVKLHVNDIRRLSKYFFEAGTGSYIGIESNLPSTYYEVYPDYLDENESYLKKLSQKDRLGTKRILIAKSGGDIRTDAIMHPQLYRDFIEWHKKNKVELYWIEEFEAEKIRAKNSVGTTDIAFWENSFAVTFSPSDKYIRLRLLRKNEPQFGKVLEYVKEINQSAQLLTLDTNKLPIIPEEVVEKWEGYIGDLNFRDQGIGKILKKELPGKGRILDAAAGSGYETILLTKAGFDVTANEVDPVWNSILRKKIDSEKIAIETYQYDWRQLSNYLRPLYSGIVAVGNSLCMLIGKAQRQKAIKEFYELLKPGGKLILDERNFDLIMRKLQSGDDVYSKGPLYACTTMNAKLSIEDASDKLIRFNFTQVGNDKVLGALIVQAPAKNEIKNMLKKAGFKDIRTYSDLRSGIDDSASCFTYVATK